MNRFATPLLLGLLACGDPSAVVLDIRARPTVLTAAEISVSVTDDGGERVSETYSLLGESLPKTLTVNTTGRSGTLTVRVDAYDADDLHLGTGAGEVEMPGEGHADLTVLLEPSEFTVNTTFAGAQDLTYAAPGFAGRQLASAAESSLLVVWGSVDLAMGRLYGPDARPRVNRNTMNDDEFILPLSPVVADTQFSPAVAHGPDGYLVAWSEWGFEGTAIYAQGMTDDDATRLGEVESYVTSGIGGECFPTPIALVDGGYVLLWVRSDIACEDGDIRALFLDETGSPFPSVEFDIAESPGASDAYPHGAPLPGGGFAVAWHRSQGGDTDVLARLFDASGTPIGGEIAISADAANLDMLPYVVATGDEGRFAVVWLRANAGDESLLFQRFASDGSTLSQPVEIAQVTGGQDARPVMAVRPTDGALGVAWAEGDYTEGGLEVSFLLLDSSGAAIGAPMRVPTVLVGNQATPSIALAADGAFVVAWSDESKQGPDKDETAVKARVIYP